MSDFSDKPFVAGSVTGLRAFRVDRLGRLTGVTHQKVWRPDVNEAECYAAETFPIPQVWGFGTASTTVSYYLTQASANPGRPSDRKKKGDEASTKKKVHNVAGLHCQCGYYAYFDGCNDYLPAHQGAGATATTYPGVTYTFGSGDSAPRIGGIVEGWGTVTIGTRGFRASKARIVALIFPTEPSTPLAVLAQKVRRNYPEVALFDSEHQAVAAFPLTDTAPATPADDDFWTRSAS